MSSIGRTIGLVWLLSGLVLTAQDVRAGSIGDFLEALIRAGRKAERVPDKGRILKHLDDIPTKRLPKLNEAESLRRLERLEHVDDSLRRRFRDLSLDQRSQALEMGDAAQRVLRRYDDGVDILRKLDGDGIVQLRTYGDFVADGVKLAGPEYKLVVRKTGTGAHRFLAEYLRPNYKKLAAAGLVATYLASPEKFHDAAGNLTAWATEHLASLGIEVASAVPRGVWHAFERKFGSDPIFSAFGVSLIVACLALSVPALRRLVWRRVQPFSSSQRSDPKSARAIDGPPHFQE